MSIKNVKRVLNVKFSLREKWVTQLLDDESDNASFSELNGYSRR